MVTRTRTARALLAIGVCVAPCWQSALAWDAIGHRAITLLALDSVAADKAGLPAYLFEESERAKIASQACEPDRWRNTNTVWLTNENSPDHYIDIEQLEDYSMTLASLPKLRSDYIGEIAVARDAAPQKYPPIDEVKDPAHTKMTPGMLPYAILENYAKLQSSFKTLRTLEALKDPARANQLEQEKANVVYHMGVLSHFVGDAAQPLHTTIHHHGWVGSNPENFTKRTSFHAEIDGAVLAHHNLTYAALTHSRRPTEKLEVGKEFEEVKGFIERSYAHVRPLYSLDKEGHLLNDEGKAFFTDRLEDAGAMLAALYELAWKTSEPTEQDISGFVRFDKFGWETETK